MRTLSLLPLCLVLALAPGCSTVAEWNEHEPQRGDHGPGIYGGTRYWVAHGGPLTGLEFMADGPPRLERTGLQPVYLGPPHPAFLIPALLGSLVVGTLDLPLSLTADTALLPVAVVSRARSAPTPPAPEPQPDPEPATGPAPPPEAKDRGWEFERKD